MGVLRTLKPVVHLSLSTFSLSELSLVHAPSSLHRYRPQAAVLEAQACMGSSGALLGRSHLVGPNPYATINLIPGGAARGRVPRLQTPYQVSQTN